MDRCNPGFLGHTNGYLGVAEEPMRHSYVGFLYKNLLGLVFIAFVIFGLKHLSRKKWAPGYLGLIGGPG